MMWKEIISGIAGKVFEPKSEQPIIVYPPEPVEKNVTVYFNPPTSTSTSDSPNLPAIPDKESAIGKAFELLAKCAEEKIMIKLRIKKDGEEIRIGYNPNKKQGEASHHKRSKKKSQEQST